jgi:TolB-like protein/Flp pilus assembly protein TadD
MASVWGELKRRNVVKVAMGYAVVGWLLVEIASTVLPTFGTPHWVLQTLTFVIILGFPLALILAWAYELTPEGLKREKDVDRSEHITRVTGRKLDFVIIGVMAIAITFLMMDKFVLNESPNTGGGEIAATSQSIAVLPFEDLSPTGDQEYFSDGMTEEIIAKLSRIKELRVISRTTVGQFKDSPLDVPSIGRKLSVDYVLEGSVRKADDRIRVTAQLISTDDDRHLWSDNFDAELDDVFEVQENIAQTIVVALGIHLTDFERKALASTPTEVVPAYEAYLRGQALIEHWNSLEMVNASRQFFQTALELDASYAMAMAGLASVEAQTYRNHDSDPSRLEHADQLLDAAEAIEPYLVRTMVARGEVMAMRYDYAGATVKFREALELEPDNYFVWDLLCWALAYETPPRAKEAEEACREGLSIAPSYGEIYYHLARALIAQERYDEASEAILQLESIWPSSSLIASGRVWIELARGNYSKALELLDKSESTGSPTSLTLAIRASAHSALKDTAKALSLLDEAMAKGFKDLAWLKGNEDFEPLRKLPEFSALLEEHGLQ